MSDNVTAPDAGAIPFTIASRPQARFSNVQSVSNFTSGSSFAPIPLVATGWLRKIELLFTATFTCASAAATVAGDAPWNLVSGITFSDATGSPILQTISAYNLYLVNKWLPSGTEKTDIYRPWVNPHAGPEYAYSASGASGSATFRLFIDMELDYATAYGCIPNLDANAALQLKIDYAIYTVAFTGTTPSAATLSVRVSQHYWAPVATTLQGRPVSSAPPGAGDYVETRIENVPVSASAENIVQTQSRGGMVQGAILVSRAAGVRTAITAGSNFGILLDNYALFEGIPIEEWYGQIRRGTGNQGADITTSYAPITAGTAAGIDRGVIPVLYQLTNSYRDTSLATRGGSLVQYKATPGASATTLEIVTRIIQSKDSSAFYARY